ncbi:MAG: hypothetical protein EU550_02260 [Promethearchaeota archaeon]|nr:MAG: hypothetical protein EU550_02260 [Candidatus Lokiarchaeota archaeon]
MNETEFKQHLEEIDLKESLIEEILTQLSDFEGFLSKEKHDLTSFPLNRIIQFSEHLVSKDPDEVLGFLRALIRYANYSKRNEIITKVIDISESYNAMENLYLRIAKYYGELIRDHIFEGITVPPLGVDPESKPAFTKVILKRIKESLGEEKTIDLLSPCLHGRPPDDIEGDRRLLEELGIDGFLNKKHKELIKRLEKHKDEGTLEFAQKIDDQILQYVKKNQKIGIGTRKGGIIYVSKIPYQMRAFLDATDEKMKRFFICYCPWIRGAIKNGSEKEITDNFCHCSAGWYKLYWDQIFGQAVKVEPIKTALIGSYECTFKVHIPENIKYSD